MIFTNKHVVVAMLVAPVLAILAWFAVDYFLSEKPHAAVPGGAYALIAKSNCRYDSGQCDLENGDFKLTLKPVPGSAGGTALELMSRFPLQTATIGLIDADNEGQPTAMLPSGSESTRWLAALPAQLSATTLIRLAVIAKETTYYAEVPVIFLQQP
jgi:hypothetical protein